MQYDEVFIQGDVKKDEGFVAYYLKDGKIDAVSG